MSENQRPQQVRRSKVRLRQLSSTQIMFAAVLAIGLMLAINFSNRISEERRLSAIRDTVLREIDLLQREQGMLIAQLSYAESDAFVEAWAHGEGKMLRDGEILVVPIPSNQASPLTQNPNNTIASDPEAIPASNVIETTLPEPEPWQLWWSLFFDAPPPTFE